VSPIRLLIADDQELIRTGFRLFLDGQPDMEVVGEAADGLEAVERCRALLPDVVLMDIRMPRLDGVEATRTIAGSPDRPGPKVVVLTTFDLDEDIFGALRAGASAFLLKDAPRERLLEAVRVAHAGDALLSPSVTRRLVERFAALPEPGRRATARLDELTLRERDVLDLVARGLSNAEIAERLVVADATVKTHVARVLAKLGVRDRIQAVVLAHEEGLVGPMAPPRG
jgi:DNA-binding NarL/FixJ family response regulator